MYIKAVTKAERTFIMKTHILPTMFGYWASIGKHPEEGLESQHRVQVTSKLQRYAKNLLKVRTGTDRMVCQQLAHGKRAGT
jgi:hypothetical protein